MKLTQLTVKLDQLRQLCGNGVIQEFGFKYSHNKTFASRGPLKLYYANDNGELWYIDDYIDSAIENITTKKIVPVQMVRRADSLVK